MMTLSADQAFAAYEAVRHRLPRSNPPKTFRRCKTLADIADEFDTFLLDAFGVLNIGETAITGTPERIADMRKAGKRIIIVSNAASVPTAALEQKYRRLGYDFAPEDIVTSRSAMMAHLAGAGPRHWGVMGDAQTALDIDSYDILADDPGTYRAAEGFLLVGTADWTDARQARLEQALSETPRPVLVANPDIVAPREAGFSVEPGYFAHRIADATGIEPKFFGKPFANIYDLALARLGDIDKSRTVMVGDSLHTDILGGQTAAVATALVSGFGMFAGVDVERFFGPSGIVPDVVIERP